MSLQAEHPPALVSIRLLGQFSLSVDGPTPSAAAQGPQGPLGG